MMIIKNDRNIINPNYPTLAEVPKCAEPVRSRMYTSPSDIEFVQIALNASQAGIVTRDFLVQFARPHVMFFVASADNNAQTMNIWFHWNLLGLPVTNGGTNTITPIGTEQWVTIANSQISQAKIEQWFIRLRNPIKQFYIDADHAFGVTASPVVLTFGGTDDIEYMAGIYNMR